MKFITALFISIIIAACATATPQDPAQAVYAAQSSYAAALTIAVAYKKLPPCNPKPAPVLCSEAKVVAQLQQADDVAHPALQAAQATVRTPGAGANSATAIVAAQQAVQALVAITSTLQVKP